MIKIIKVIVYVIGALVCLIILDSAHAYYFKTDPILGLTEHYDEYYYSVKRGLFVSTYTYCNYQKEARSNFGIYLNHPYKGCEGEELKNMIKDSIQSFASILGNNNDYDKFKDDDSSYKWLMGLPASPKYIEEIFNGGEFSDKESYVAARVIEDITGCDMAKEFNEKWDTGNKFFKLWAKSSCETKKKLYKSLEIYD